MKRSIKIGRLFGLEIRAMPSTLLSIITIWTALTLLAIRLLRWKPEKAILTGLLATLIHYTSDFWHQLGHAQVAEQTGYPMSGMEFRGPIAISQYPRNEGMISADVHIQRALGGPIFSLILSVLSGVLMLALRPLGGPAFVLVIFTFVDNLLVFTVGALLPLGFTDGSTLLHWWGHRQKGRRIDIQGQR
jgi:hypothetical protein